jgi:hypothetical protein
MYILYLEISSLGFHWAIQKCHDQNFSTKSYGEQNTTAKSLFLPISFFLYFDSNYNFDHGEREEEKKGNDQKAEKGGLHCMLGKAVMQNSACWRNCHRNQGQYGNCGIQH